MRALPGFATNGRHKHRGRIYSTVALSRMGGVGVVRPG
jgi:hypothetical protein